MVDIVLPELGEGVEKATVSYWYVQEGGEIKEGDDAVELTTDKATFNLPSPATGRLKEILAQEGDEVKVGEVLGRIEA